MPHVPTPAEPPQVGDLAPNFTAKGADGDEYRLSDLNQHSHVLLLFYPKDMTTG
jgi:peroxiredoxin